ncbi:VWA domain containing CoxE-like protein [Sporotomaculum syntrophicum]|uniref:VWA domain containing CoxE-like protein n=1 Tax=Sporotomaculum syntrophicum TaxID=182264 RepID=A0A9D3AYT4_9FIRM|nr:VWA domain-containing protein [Sporotomaculum syntrophicum]KAF1085796.1 VWA domain containing CoxE-like protein [Sporotomaculum syntrophicum]
MFINFLYELKKTGVPVSLVEWMTLMEALSKGLAFSSLREFYHVARTVLVKSETQFDNYDLAFQNYFSGIESPANWVDDILGWLKDGLPPQILVGDQSLPQDLDEREKQPEFTEKTEKQEQNNQEVSNAVAKDGGMYFGHGGFNPKGNRIGGVPGNFSAIQVAARRDYRGYRSDVILGVRRFEAALRVLRELTNLHEGVKDELDINGTIDATCRHAGRLELVWARPRKNNLKIVLVMDSGGSMDMHINLCSQLFSAFKRSSHLKDLRIYYFHNCIYDNLYVKPACIGENAIATHDFLRNFDVNYRLIIIGDASMAESELLAVNGAIDWDNRNQEPGLVWLKRLARHFSHAVWLNPIPTKAWNEQLNYRARSINMIRKLIPMFELSVTGLEKAVKQLKVSN